MNQIEEAIKILKDGGIVIFPTDTAYGIGCRMDNNHAVERLFKIRRRPVTQATPVLVSAIDMAEDYLQSPTPYNVRRLMKKYWPGALTIVYSCDTDRVSPLVRGNSPNLGVRMPDHKDLLKIIEKVGVPILGPSANFHKLQTPYSYEDLDPALLKLVDLVLIGSCKIGNVSTVIDCSVTPFNIIRQGAVKI